MERRRIERFAAFSLDDGLGKFAKSWPAKMMLR